MTPKEIERKLRRLRELNDDEFRELLYEVASTDNELAIAIISLRHS